MRHNKGLTIEELASHYEKSERTIYRWLRNHHKKNSPDQHLKKKGRNRTGKYTPEIFTRIIELKKEIPQSSAPIVRKLLKKEFPNAIPSLSTIYTYFHEQDLIYKNRNRRQGYIKFERSKPNDLWQIDIKGVQTVGHLEKLYLIALLDDNSRFIVAAEYFKDQKGINVVKIIRNAVLAYGRPNQIVADNGTQFKNLGGELGTKYTRLLEILNIIPIFAKPNHPQTKGKLERWFGTVKRMFLGGARLKVNQKLDYSLTDFNQLFKDYVDWYNTEKPHRSLPGNTPSLKRYFNIEDRIFRPLQATVN